MTTIVIGGHTRKVGKTSVTEGILRAFRDNPWVALKISTHWHEEPASQQAYSIHEETSAGTASDSARYLAAGARRAFWIRVKQGRMSDLMPALAPILQSSPFVIMESNAVLEYVQPDLYVMVLRYGLEDFKESARETLKQANAVITIGPEIHSPSWKASIEPMITGLPVFTAPDPQVLPEQFLDFVRVRLNPDS